MYRDILFYGSGFDILWFALLFMIISAIVVYLFQHFTQWQRNRNAPRLIVGADVISKRSDLRFDESGESMAAGDYFVTFEMESGDRMEFRLPGHDFRRIAEGDFGRLTFQGSRYIAFMPEKACA